MKEVIKIWMLAGIGLIIPFSDVHAQLQTNLDAVTTEYAATPGGIVARVKRIGDPLGSSAPWAATGNWTTPPTTPVIVNWTQTTMGQVFGVMLNKQGDVYFAATAMYDTATTGYPNPKRFVAATLPPTPVSNVGFHLDAITNSIGLIYKASNSALNTVNAIITAEVAGQSSIPGTSSGIGTSRIPNSGYGIGNIAFSKDYNTLYASNLEDGKIYAISTATNTITDIFDPLTTDNGMAGIAPLGERVFGVAVNKEFDGSVRLYYAVLYSAGVSRIRSVALGAGGAFQAATDAEEIILPTPSSLLRNYVSDLAFSCRGELLVSEKGEEHNANVFQYYGRHNAWSAPQVLAVSNFSTMKNAGGGADYASIKNALGVICDSLIWTQENALGPNNITPTWYGLQSMPHNGYVNNGNLLNEAYVVDLDGVPGAGVKGKFGDVVFYDSLCADQPTDICALLNISIVKDTTPGSCCYNLVVRNNYHGGYITAIKISLGNLAIDNVAASNVWGGVTYQTPHAVTFGDTNHLWYMPEDTTFTLAKICVRGSGNDVLTLGFIGNAPQFDTVCTKTVTIEGCGKPVDTSCAAILNQKVICDNGVLKMQFQVRNESNFTMRAITIYSVNPNVTATPSFNPIADLAPGNTSPVITVPLVVQPGATTGCFFFAACDLNVFPGTSGQYPQYCCMDSIEYCVQIPTCDDCDAITVSATQTDTAQCCYRLQLTNNYNGGTISCVRFHGNSGTQFAILSGWNVQSPVSSSNITICAPGGGIGTGVYADFASFCLTGEPSTNPSVTIEFLGPDGEVICAKTLEFTGCQLVEPTCANIVNDSLYCDGKTTKLTFYIKNNSPFPIAQADLRVSDTSFHLDTNRILPSPPIAPSATGGPYTISIDSSTTGNHTFCLYLSGHNAVYTDSSAATICCTDSLGVICLPFIQCDSSCCTTCCTWAGMTIPNGITPNGDGLNDVWTITHSDACKNISITIYNRWGNIVYEDANYLNTWGGTNQNGEKLPQGTYYAVIKLDSGEKRAMFIDIRY